MADPHVDQRLAAILAADVAGYSRLMEADERATVATLDIYRGVFQEQVTAHGGRIVDTAGDSVLAVFLSAIGAVEAAIAIQDELRGRNESLPEDQRMHFRLGVNLGDVIEKDDGSIYGSGVNVAARLEGLAEPGGICLSGSAHEQVEGKIDLGFQDIGEHEVKNIVRPVRAYRVDTGSAPHAHSEKPLVPPDRPSIAVLPLENLSGDAEQDYFADGLTEDIITALSHFRELFVIARNTTFAYKGTSPNIPELGATLGVQYVVEGSVRRAGNRLRLNAQLIEASGGGHVWAQRYDRELTDIFDVQDELTASIVGALGLALRSEGLERARAKAPDQLNAYDLVLRASQMLYTAVSPERHAQSRAWAEQAVSLSPDYARAHAMLSLAYLDEHRWKLNPVPERSDPLASARAEAQNALELDGSDAFSHYVMGKILFFAREFDLYADSFERALQINENYADARAEFAIRLAVRGDAGRARSLIDDAVRLNPNYPLWYKFAYIWIGMKEKDYEPVIALIKSLAMPDLWLTHLHSMVAYAHLGRTTEAQASLAELLRCLPRFADDPRSHLRGLGYTEDDVEDRVGAFRKAGLDVPDEPAAGD